MSDKSEAEFKKIYPENQGTVNLIQANYSGLSTEEAAAAVNKYLEVYKYDAQKDKLAVISHLRRESEYFEKQVAGRSTGVDPNIANYRVYKNKELEYKLLMEYYESRAKLVDKYNQLDIDKLSLGQKKSLATLEKDLEALRTLARRNGWPND